MVVNLIDRSIPWLLGLLGLWMWIDAAYYFYTGVPMFTIGWVSACISLETA